MSTSAGPDTSPPPPTPPTHGAGDPAGPRVGRDHIRDLPRLRRSNADRRVAGVAGGLARHLDVDPLLVRVAFVVLTLFGGGGLLLYGAAWLVVPEDDTGEAVVRTDDGVRTIVLAVAGGMALLSLVGDTLGGPDVPWPVLVIGLALLVIFARHERRHAPQPWPASGAPVPPAGAGPGAAPTPAPTPAPAAGPVFAPYQPPAPRDPRRRGPLLFWFTLALSALLVGVVGCFDIAGVDVPSAAYAATVLATTGVMLVIGAFYGRAGGLILVGLLAAGATATAAAVDDGDTGRKEFVVDRAGDLRPDYRIGAGELVVDLSDITDPTDLDALDGRTLRVDGNVGHLLVVVPDDGLRVEVSSAVDLGESRIFERTSDSGPATGTYGRTTDPTLTVAADLTVGQVTVRTEGARR